VTKDKTDLLEKKVKEAVKSVLKGWGCYQFWPVQAGMGAHTVDCLACVPVRITKEMVGTTLGVFVAIEAKRTKIDKPTGAQGEVLRQVRKAGGGAALVHTVHDMEIEDGLVRAIEEREPEVWVTVGAKK
jgi:ribosomal protein S19